MPDADGDDPAQEVEILLPVQVPNVLPLGVVNHQRVFEVGCDAVEDVFLFFANDFVFGHEQTPLRPGSSFYQTVLRPAA